MPSFLVVGVGFLRTTYVLYQVVATVLFCPRVAPYFLVVSVSVSLSLSLSIYSRSN